MLKLSWQRSGGWLFLFVWLVYSLSPPFTSFDSYWSVPTALEILGHVRTNVDEFVSSAPVAAKGSLECVPAAGPPSHYNATSGCPGGHWYNFYPLAVSIFALPLIAVLKMAAPFLGLPVPKSILSWAPQLAAFFSGDLVGGHALAELWCASTFGAMAAWVQYQTAKLFLSRRMAAGVALLFAFGTPEWSTASRNLFQHGLTVLLLSAAIYLLLRGMTETRLIPYAAIPLACSFAVRPWNAVSVAALTAHVAIHHRSHLLRFLLWASPTAALYFGYQVAVRHSVLPLYITGSFPVRLPFVQGLAMHLISPSRGLLIFTPIVLFSFVGMYSAMRLRWAYPLAPYLIVIVVLHTALLSPFWPGHGYGPRYWADDSHLFAFFWIPAILFYRKLLPPVKTVAAAVFVVFAAWSIFAHGRGATSIAANQWSALPISVDQAMWRVWDWSDPQFLRGLRP